MKWKYLLVFFIYIFWIKKKSYFEVCNLWFDMGMSIKHIGTYYEKWTEKINTQNVTNHILSTFK